MTVIQINTLKRLSEEFQADCHLTVEQIMHQSKKVSYQDATNIWLFQKLAQLDLRLQEIERYLVL